MWLEEHTVAGSEWIASRVTSVCLFSVNCEMGANADQANHEHGSRWGIPL